MDQYISSVFILFLTSLSTISSFEIAMTTLEFYPGGYNLTSSGVSVSVVNEMEYNIFSITEERLKDGVEALTGSRPDRVSLSHEEFSNASEVVWRPTFSYLSASWLQLTNVSRNSEVLNTMRYTNNGTTTMAAGTSINPRVINTRTHRWLDAGLTWKFMGYTVSNKGIRSTTYTNGWGQNRHSTFDVILNQNFNSVQVPPGESVKAVLMKHRNRFLLTILYSVVLKGEALAYWNNGDHYRTFNVDELFPSAGLHTTTSTVEFVDYELINETWELL